MSNKETFLNFCKLCSNCYRVEGIEYCIENELIHSQGRAGTCSCVDVFDNDNECNNFEPCCFSVPEYSKKKITFANEGKKCTEIQLRLCECCTYVYYVEDKHHCSLQDRYCDSLPLQMLPCRYFEE